MFKCFWTILGTLQSNDADNNENVKKNNTFYKQNNNFARASRFFVHFFARFCTTTTWKCLISRFMEDANKQRRKQWRLNRVLPAKVVLSRYFWPTSGILLKQLFLSPSWPLSQWRPKALYYLIAWNRLKWVEMESFFFAFYGNKEKLFAFLGLYLLVIYSIVTCLSKFNTCDLF